MVRKKLTEEEKKKRNRACQKKYYEKNREYYKQRNKDWVLKNPEKNRAFHKKYRLKHKKYYYGKKKEWEKKKLLEDPTFEVGEAIKDSARSRGLSHPHKSNEYRDWFNSVEKKCAYCGSDHNVVNKFLKKKNVNKQFVRLTIDRIDSNGGYEISNIILSCYVCNLSKSSIISHDDFKEIAKKYIAPKIL